MSAPTVPSIILCSMKCSTAVDVEGSKMILRAVNMTVTGREEETPCIISFGPHQPSNADTKLKAYFKDRKWVCFSTKAKKTYFEIYAGCLGPKMQVRLTI